MIYKTIICISAIFTVFLFAEGETNREIEPKLSGGINVTSTPPNAAIFLNGLKTGRKTPAFFKKIKAGLNTIEVTLSDYLFAKRQINIIPDTTISLSFKLISLSDTAHIIGDLQLGILSLPRAPLNSPYLVDNKQVYSEEITLNAGKHHIVWEGGNIYTSLDTIIEIYPGKLTTFPFLPERLIGKLTVSPFPYDADVYINNRLNSTGLLRTVLSTGSYSVIVQRNGYYPHEQQVAITPGKHLVLEIDLTVIPDRDNDGFLDSCDKCPDVYGLYGGCPKQNRGDAIKRYKEILVGNLKKQPLTFSVNTISYLFRNPTNTGFKDFISYFNDGKFFCNNQNGLIFANTYTVSFRGFQFAVELGQWLTGLEYKKALHNPIFLKTEEDTSCIFYKDTATGVEPRISFPSTALSCGFNLTIRKFNCTYSLGYQWEDILITDLVPKEDLDQFIADSLEIYTGRKETIVFDNNFWFHKLRFEFDLGTGRKFLPALYSSFALSVGSKHTGWHAVQAGVLYKFIPSAKRKLRIKTEKTGG